MTVSEHNHQIVREYTRLPITWYNNNNNTGSIKVLHDENHFVHLAVITIKLLHD